VRDALTRDQRVHAVLQRGAHLRQHHALAQQVAQVAQLARRHISLGQQVGAQQMRQRARVDRVGLDARRGDRLGPQRVREVQLVARVLEQLGQPLPAVGRLDGDPRLTREATKQLEEDVRVVGDPA